MTYLFIGEVWVGANMVDSCHAVFFLRIIWKCWHFIWFLSIDRQLKSFLIEDEDFFTLHNQYHTKAYELTHCILMMPYGDRDLCQHWLRRWPVAWRHQAITWTHVDVSSVMPHQIHLRAISRALPQPSITKISFIITYIKFHSNVPEANELTFVTKWVI